MDSNAYLFQRTADGGYVRKCFGLEAFGSVGEELCDGAIHVTVSTEATIPSATTWTALEPKIRAAWLKFRHMVPGVACTTFKDADDQFAFRYIVPKSLQDVEKWAKDSIVFTDGADPLYERHCALKEKHWWKMSANHHNAELHVSPSPSPSGWIISLNVSHNSIDGRSAFYMLDLFYELLVSVLENKASPVSELQWGEEVARLGPPGSFVQALLKDGKPPQLSSIPPPAPPKASEDSSEAPPAMMPWVIAPHKVGDNKSDIGKVVKFSREVTAKLHAASKKRGRTITQVMSTVIAVVISEGLLTIAGAQGGDRFETLATGFKSSTVFPIGWNFISQRPKLADGYDSLKSGKPSPLFTTDAVPLFLSMDAVRNIVKIDEDLKTATHDMDLDIFWNSLVREVADGWDGIDKSLDAYLGRETTMNSVAGVFSPSILQVVTPVISSIGDLERLNLLNAYLPSAKNPTVTVNDLVFAIRVKLPVIIALIYQYNGELSLHLHTSAEYTSEEDIALFSGLFHQLVAEISA